MKRTPCTSRLIRGVLMSMVMTGVAFAAAAIASAGIVDKTPLPTGEGDIEVVRDGQVVHIDPQTGRMRPLPQDQAQTLLDELLPQGRSTPVESLQPTLFASGMLSIQLPDDFVEYAVLRVLPDGSLVTDCVQGSDNAMKLLFSDLPTAAKETTEASIAPETAAPAAPIAKAKPVCKAAKRTPTSATKR